MTTPSNIPLNEAVARAEEWIKQGATIFQKFTCASCGSRQTIDVPNTFYRSARCEECSHITDLDACGCGFMAIFAARTSPKE